MPWLYTTNNLQPTVTMHDSNASPFFLLFLICEEFEGQHSKNRRKVGARLFHSCSIFSHVKQERLVLSLV